MKESVKKFLHNGRQAVLVTVVLMLICGLLFPCLLTGLSALIFPHQAAGSMITVDNKTLGAHYVGQEFTEDYYMWSRPSAYHYNVYVEDEEGNQTYTDGSEFPGIGSGSNNYAPSNEALWERVEEVHVFAELTPGQKVRLVAALEQNGHTVGFLGDGINDIPAPVSYTHLDE